MARFFFFFSHNYFVVVLRGPPPSPFRSSAHPRAARSQLSTRVSRRLHVSEPARGHRSLGGSPRGAQARAPVTQESRSQSLPGWEQPQTGAGRQSRGPAASTPVPGSADQAPPAPDSSGRPQHERRIALGALRRTHTARRPDLAPPR
ncbi:hypothetical protein NDU88_004213 [Pleurodeles waltl]|uniref:Uncharacterized protein n=1 Tax=Pleurodeles waltl TaxID=8319 RepID=A0AAV7W938_PLEWA|nr:hypothetical protein NDU88_004213 [Pleurodeles waltl]